MEDGGRRREVRFDSAGRMRQAPHSCQGLHSGATSMENNLKNQCEQYFVSPSRRMILEIPPPVSCPPPDLNTRADARTALRAARV